MQGIFHRGDDHSAVAILKNVLIPIRNHKACNLLALAGKNPVSLVAVNSISGNFIKPDFSSTIAAAITNL